MTILVEVDDGVAKSGSGLLFMTICDDVVPGVELLATRLEMSVSPFLQRLFSER